MDSRLKKLSIRGRDAYIIMCFERYVLKHYPDRDWSRVDDMMWKICDDSDFIDSSTYKYSDIIPEFLHSCASYADDDCYISEEDFY